MKILILVIAIPAVLNAVKLGLTKKRISESDKNDILNIDYDSAFDTYLDLYDDLENKSFKVSSSPITRSKVRADQKKQFVKNIKEIKAHNRKYERGESNFEMTVNSFTIMSRANRHAFLGLNITKMSNKYEIRNKFRVSSGVGAPSSWDWKARGWVSGVKNQGGCGSCWTFPAAALLEFAHKQCTGNMVQYSEQQLLDCTYEKDDPSYNGCKGGFYTAAWNWVVENDHLAKMSDHKYKGSDGRCSTYQYYSSGMKGVMRLKGYKSVGSSEGEIKDAMQIMPLAVAFLVEDDFYSVGSGVYDGCRSGRKDINHAVTLTAYTPQYWEIKNSWGADWGIRGYGRLQRGRGSICNLLSHAYYIEYEDLDKNDGKDKDEVDPTEEEKEEGGDYNVVLSSARLSSVYSESSGAFNCIDKDQSTLCHTNYENKPWLEVKFADRAPVNTVIVYNLINDCCYDRLSGATVAVTDGQQTVGVCGTIRVNSDLTRDKQTYRISCGGKQGDGVKIQLQDTDILHLYEVEIKSKQEEEREESPTEGDEACEDKSDKCDIWHEDYDYCKTGDYIGWMKDNCAATCKFCKGCQDADVDNCPIWADKYNYCTTGEYVQYMQANCKVSCGTCGGGSAKYIPSSKVQQSTTLTWNGNSHPASLAVDSSLDTQSHTECGKAHSWFRYNLSTKTRVDHVILVNGKLNYNRVRLHGAKVTAVDTDNDVIHTCGTISVRNSDTIDGQTYKVNCEGNPANYVEVSLKNSKCLELRDIKVYGKVNKDKKDEKDNKDENGCGGGLVFCDGVCKHEHMCGKNYGK